MALRSFPITRASGNFLIQVVVRELIFDMYHRGVHIISLSYIHRPYACSRS